MCDTPNPAVRAEFGTYLEIFRTLLANSFNKVKDSNSEGDGLDAIAGGDYGFGLVGFDVVGAMEYPDVEADSETWDGILLSGSGEDALWLFSVHLIIRMYAFAI